jgi:hypothetical protein
MTDTSKVDGLSTSSDTWIDNAKTIATALPEAERAAVYVEIAKTRAMQALAAAVQALAERGE